MNSLDNFKVAYATFYGHEMTETDGLNDNDLRKFLLDEFEQVSAYISSCDDKMLLAKAARYAAVIMEEFTLINVKYETVLQDLQQLEVVISNLKKSYAALASTNLFT